MRCFITLAALTAASLLTSAQVIEYVDIEPPLDGPTMMKYVFNPEHVASEMINAWTSREDLPFDRLKGLVRSIGMEVLDTDRDVNPDPEEGEAPLMLTLFGGRNCNMTRTEGPTSDDSENGDSYEEIDFKSRDGRPFAVIIMNVAGFDDESYNFGNSMESSVRVAYSDAKSRNDILAELLEITGFKYNHEEEIYAGKDGDDIDYGTVITTTDDDETGLHWVEICCFL